MTRTIEPKTMTQDPEAQSQQVLYRRRRAVLRRQRRRRYQTDAEYREACKARAAEWARTHARARKPVPLPAPTKGIVVGGTRVAVFGRLEVARACGVTPGRFSRWVTEGVVPEPAHRTPSGWRWWTHAEAHAIVEGAREGFRETRAALSRNIQAQAIREAIARRAAALGAGGVPAKGRAA